MGEVSRFFDSVSGDRRYSAEEHAEFMRLIARTGVTDYGTNLQVTANDNMSVTVAQGSAVVEGYGYWLKDAPAILNIAAANTQPRLDRIVLRLDKSVANRFVQLAVKKGTASASPVVPSATRSGNIYEIVLARIRVAANAVSISAADIEDERETPSACGLTIPKRIMDMLNQDVRNTASPTFAKVTAGTITATTEISAPKITGAVYG